MAYLVDEESAARSRNHPTKVKAAQRDAAKRARKDARKLKRFRRGKSGPVKVIKYGSKPALEQPKTFYDSDAWRDLRYKVLVKYGARCQCCGATRHDNVRIHVDHIKPRSRFPELELVEDNLQVLCEPCNMGKRASDLTDWR